MTAFSLPQANPHLEKNLQRVNIQQDLLARFCQKYPIRKLSLFGSILRENFTDSSNIDFLVEFLPEARAGYFELIRMENELTDIVSRQVDLRTSKELSRYFRQEVMEEAAVQYVQN